MKKFITIALAIAVLFSFAACQQVTYDGQVVKMDASINDGTYLVGETITAADFTFVGYTNIGAEITIPASDVTMDDADADGEYVVNAANLPSFTYNKSNNVSAIAPFTGEAVTKIKVESTSLTSTYTLPAEQIANALNYEEITSSYADATVTFTAEYDGGSKQLTMTQDEYAAFIRANDDVVVDTSAVTVESAVARIEAIELRTTEGYVAYYGEDEEPADVTLSYAAITAGVSGKNATIADTEKGIYAVAKYQGGYEVYMAASDLSFTVNDEEVTDIEDTLPAGCGIGKNDKSVEVAVTYDGTGVVPGFSKDDRTAAKTVDIAKDAIDTSTIELDVSAFTTIKNINYDDSETATIYDAADFGIELSAKMLSGEDASLTMSEFILATKVATGEETSGYDKDNCIAFNAYDFSDIAVNDAVEIKVTGTVAGKAVTETVTVDVVTGE